MKAVMYDYKGYLGQPPIAGNWSAHCLPLLPEQVQGLSFGPKTAQGPTFQRGNLHIEDEPADTWLDMLGFYKGYVWVNGHNLGRYWEAKGPLSLFVISERCGYALCIHLDAPCRAHTQFSAGSPQGQWRIV